MRKEEDKMHIASTVVSSEDLSYFISQMLKPQLPYSLPLLRRCQYHASRSSQSSDAEIWWVTATKQPDIGIQSQYGKQAVLRDGHHWLAAHIDLSNAGQTQVWIFGSWEAEFSVTSDPMSAVRESHNFPIFSSLVNALFRHLQKVHIPKLGHDPPPQWQRLKDSGKIVSIPYSRSKVLFGTLPECYWALLDDYGSGGNEGVSREDKGYLKHIFTSTADSLMHTSPPDTLYFAPMEEKHLQTILDRSNIPRSLETLRQLHIIGLFNESKVPIAWGMLGKDASLSSLHTEPEYRRQGLAEIVTRRLFADQVNLFMDKTNSGVADSAVYSHSDVSAANIPSLKVMEKLGGKVMWKVAWIEVELGEETLLSK